MQTTFLLAFGSDHVPDPGAQAPLYCVIEVPYILGGALAWRRRPDSRFWPLMIGAGFVAFLSNLAWANSPPPQTIGQTFDLVPVVIYLHVFLSYPNGRLETRPERALVLIGYLLAMIPQVASMMLGCQGLAAGDKPVTCETPAPAGVSPRNRVGPNLQGEKMSAEEWALIASVVFSGLWSGLLAMLVLILHRVMAAMNGPDFARFLGRFLPIARKVPFNYLAVIGMVIAPVVALFALDSGDTAFVLTAIGLALTITGPLLVSNRLSEPNYDVMLAWNPTAMPEGWEAIRRRYFALDWIRAVATWCAFALFLAALVEIT